MSVNISLSFFDSAVKEIFAREQNKHGDYLIDFLPSDYNFNPMVYSLVRKYLDLYPNDAEKYDIVVTAFTQTFLNNFKKIYHDFVGHYLDETGKEKPIKIQTYTTLVFTRALIKVSERHSNFNKHHLNFNLEDETDTETFDRIYTTYDLEPELIEDLVQFEDLCNLLKNQFNETENPKRYSKLLDMLLQGYSSADIAKTFNVSRARLSALVKQIRNWVKEIAQDLGQKGDCALSDRLDLVA